MKSDSRTGPSDLPLAWLPAPSSLLVSSPLLLPLRSAFFDFFLSLSPSFLFLLFLLFLSFSFPLLFFSLSRFRFCVESQETARLSWD